MAGRGEGRGKGGEREGEGKSQAAVTPSAGDDSLSSPAEPPWTHVSGASRHFGNDRPQMRELVFLPSVPQDILRIAFSSSGVP